MTASLHASPTRSIASSTLWQFASQLIMAALSVVTVKLVAIGLTKELAGIYNSSYGFLQIFGILADFGLYAVAVRELSRAEDRERVLGTLIVLRTIIMALSLGSALLIVWVVPAWHGTPLPLGVSIAAFVPAFTLLAGILRTVFQVEHRMQYVFIAEVIQRIVTVSAIAALVILGVRQSTDVWMCYAFLAIGGAGSLVLFVLSFISARKFLPIRPRWDAPLLRSTLRTAAPYGFAFLCVALYRQSDVGLIALLRPDYELQNASYGFVQRMMDMAYLLPTFLLNSTLPGLSARGGEERAPTVLGKTLVIILAIGVVSFLFAALWSRPLMSLLTTPAYLSGDGQAGADTALKMLALPMFCNGIILFGFYVLLTRHAWKPLVACMSIGVIVALSLNLLLIPRWGFVGAATTSIVVHILLSLLLLPAGLWHQHVRMPSGAPLRLLLFSIALGFSLWMTAPLLTSDVRTVVGLMGAGLLLAFLVWGTGMIATLRRAS
jgi:O-antigen/teichoic acid export membrane protein